VKVIHNFIDPELYNRERYPNAKNQFGRGQPVLMHISNFRRVKRCSRHHRNIRAGKRPDSEQPRDGGRRTRSALLPKKKAAGLVLNRPSPFSERSTTLRHCSRQPTCSCSPSDTESFGLSALEALASGVPVVATRVGGLPEVVRDGETGFLCEVGDVDGMARVVIELLRDKDGWEQMSTLGALDARARFSQSEIVSQYEQMYQTSLEADPVS
jgi:glycosyltransferase involved in cell wall biosynthesis